jgi:hypothetical protein
MGRARGCNGGLRDYGGGMAMLGLENHNILNDDGA